MHFTQYPIILPRISSNVQVSYLYCTTFTLLWTVSRTNDKCEARLDATISLKGSWLLSVIFSEFQLHFLTQKRNIVKSATYKLHDTNIICIDSNILFLKFRSKKTQLIHIYASTNDDYLFHKLKKLHS